MMVESEAYELSEAEMLGAVEFGHAQMQPVIDLIIDLAEDAAKEPFDFQPPDTSALAEAVRAAGEQDMRGAFAIRNKQERTSAISAARDAIRERLTEEERADPEPRLGLQEARILDPARRHHLGRRAHRRARPRHRAPDRGPGGRAAAHPRLVALSPAARPRRCASPRSAPATTSR